MSTDVLERVQEKIQARPEVELFEVAEVPTKFTIDEGPAPVVPPVGERDVFVASTLMAPISLRTRPFAEGWNLVEGKRVREMERELTANGWHFFYVVPDVEGIAIARRPENAIRKALAKVFERAFEQGLNTVEIASLRVSKLFGIHRAAVVARGRHIQESPYLFATSEDIRQRMLRISARGGLLHLRPWHLGRNYREYKPF
jgi:hypothetical protein